MQTKKNPIGDLEGKRGFLFQLGVVTALALVLVAFEWTQYDDRSYDLGQLQVDLEEEEMIPITVHAPPPPPPPPPPPANPPIDIVKNDAEVQEVDPPTSEVDPNQEIQLIEIDPEPEPDPVEEAPFTIVEDMPEFPGGEAKLYEFLAKHTKYPPMAKDAGIQGIVYLSFVVEKDGSISSIEVLRGIGAGCDEESVRVLKKMPKWVPGKQRGKTVRVNYRMPFRYRMKG